MWPNKFLSVSTRWPTFSSQHLVLFHQQFLAYWTASLNFVKYSHKSSNRYYYEALLQISKVIIIKLIHQESKRLPLEIKRWNFSKHWNERNEDFLDSTRHILWLQINFQRRIMSRLSHLRTLLRSWVTEPPQKRSRSEFMSSFTRTITFKR